MPPIFERDFRGRSRMAKSGYHYQFARPALKWLFHDYLQGNDGGWSRVDLRPAEDPRVITRLKVAAGAPGGFVPAVAATLRFQPSDENPLSFFDIKAGSGGKGAGEVFAGGRSSASLLPKLFPPSADDEACAKVRACYFDPSKRFGAFGAMVLASGGGGAGGGAAGTTAAAAMSSSALRHAAVGARYSSEQASLGVILDPVAGGALRTAWAVARAGSMTAGLSLSPPKSAAAAPSSSTAGNALASSVQAALQRPSATLAYSPQREFGGASGFTAALELREGSSLALSLYQHLVLQRGVKNPFEDGNVLGIVNYLDLGLTVAAPMSSSSSSPSSASSSPDGKSSRPTSASISSHALADDPTASAQAWALGAAWQANKNLKCKATAGPEAAAVAVGSKGWTNPAVTVAANASWHYGSGSKSGTNPWLSPKFGLVIWTENFGGVRYERSPGASELRGKALVQRHAATAADAANAAGSGVLVEAENFGDRELLGQVPNGTARFM